MATEKNDYYFTGKVAWLTNIASAKYDNYAFSFFPSSDVERKAVKATGIRNGVKEDDGSKSGIEGFYYTLRSAEPFVILDDKGAPLDKKVGNGTEVKIKFVVEKFDSAKFGKITRGTVDSIIVTKLIEYVPPVKEEDAKSDVPA